MNSFFMQYGGILYLIQIFFAIIIGLYFWNLLKSQQKGKSVLVRESEKEKNRLRELRNIKLTEPLSSLSRPTSFQDVVGQEEGVSILRSALCGPNPQHVIIYGPPGVGKTAAARLVLEEARENPLSPFKENANFVEMDATICRFDERNIADPLIGSVHDPIYQGAGSMGAAGIPQPKPGACTKAHGGVLFVDEIGELHPIQMNKLLKVLEDRKVMLESAYYAEYDKVIPGHIHDIFKNGLPADFRLIGATTRMPEELPPAIRSRCLEVFFKPLDKESIEKITAGAARKINMKLDDEAREEICKYAYNGREAVNLVQLAAGIAQVDKKDIIDQSIIQKVVNNGRYTPRLDIKPKDHPLIGVVNGLAVHGANVGTLIEVEASVTPVEKGNGKWTVTGVIEEEQMGVGDKSFRRKSMAKAAVDNVMTVLKSEFGLNTRDYDIHVNFPGGVPVDGPSAGVSMATAVYSALKQSRVDNLVAMTGEISVHGRVKPVGGVMSKVEAARGAGIKKVLIPHDNWLSIFASFPEIEVKPVKDIKEVFNAAIISE
ncbi:Sporulation protease LonB [Syntrophomonas zehnderi OL-4]|uniref:endopeptidase La n=1 Tax=Syntrophomonas zehnderi OL-4 TaxID=690567 RepID=A0A0E4GCI6_9FIRM|nr:ATP-dependent protease LonB [Syntrophomonas zehnderi]CFX81755.1 Sporulation protease LonB [Syntrophomonas zehnderi OL-4]